MSTLHIQRQRRNGFTVIELVVSFAILGLLISLLLPAIQSVREAGRKTQCRSRLHQIQLAFESYEGTYGFYPGKNNGPPYHRVIARYLELTDPSQVSDVLVCPADPFGGDQRNSTGTTYVINDGVHQPGSGNGFFGLFSHYSTKQDMTDGLSNIAMLSERPTRPYSRIEEMERDNPIGMEVFWFRYTLSSSHSDLDRFIDECEWRHDRYADTPLTITRYHHVLPPNRPSCYNGGASNNERMRYADTAVSYHPGGVNLVLGDGAVRFVSNSVARDVWWAIGTRSGGETLSLRN